MAYIGLARPTVAELIEPAGTYSNAFRCGKAIQIDIEPQYAEGSLYGDNSKAEYDKEFKYADVTLNTSTLPIEAHKVMFGHTTSTEKSAITYAASDESKYTGFGFYVTEKVDGQRKYVASWLAKVKFSEGAESYKTKGDAIEYQTPSITGQALAKADGVWKEVEIFDTEEKAQEWLDQKSGKTVQPGA